MTGANPARLCGIIVHWHDEERVHRLVEAWPADEDLELVIVDNGSTGELPTGTAILTPDKNLGFAGAINLGLRETTAPLVLVMNSDVCPQPGAVEALIRGFDRWPDVAALAPRLEDSDGSSQYRWQLRRLPSRTTLILQTLLLPVTGEGRKEPAPGAFVEQPAAAALAFRRPALSRLAGFDETFSPAWFEDVDVAKRMQDNGQTIRYLPDSRFTHKLGSSIPRLGYGPFLNIYYRNLCRYLGKHYGRSWVRVARFMLVPAALLRLVSLPIRRPKRAATRRQAAHGLWRLARAAASDWRNTPLDSSSGDSPSDMDGTRR